METAILVAIVAFVSTTLGASIGAVTNYVLARRRERAEDQRDNRNLAIEIKRAARLIEIELLSAHTAAKICVDKRQLWSGDVPPLSTAAWEQYRATIAGDLSDEAWVKLCAGMRAVDYMIVTRTIIEEDAELNGTLSDSIAATVELMLRDIKEGREALNPIAYPTLVALEPVDK